MWSRGDKEGQLLTIMVKERGELFAKMLLAATRPPSRQWRGKRGGAQRKGVGKERNRGKKGVEV